MEKMHYLLNHLSFRDGIPVHKMNSNGDIEYSVEWEEETNPLLTNRHFTEHLIEVWEEKKKPVILQSELDVICGVIGDKNGNYYFWGPITEKQMSILELKQYKEIHGINNPDFRMKKAKTYAMSSDMDIFYLMLSGEMLEDIQIMEASIETRDKIAVQDMEMDQYRFYNAENEISRISYKVEQDIVEAIRTGNIDYLKNLSIGMGQERAGHLAKNEKKHQEYITVSGITIATRAAIEGGMTVSASKQSVIPIEA